MYEQLTDILTYDPQHPLLFTQGAFWLFFAVVYGVFTCIVGRASHNEQKTRLHLRNVFLMLASWWFYYKTSGTFLLLLVVLTLVAWLFTRAMDRANQQGHLRLTRILLWSSVLIDLAALGFFKYAYFGVDVINQLIGTQLTITEKILLPVGISFYTFQIISYTADVYHARIRPVRNLLDFGFYVSFFPQLVAGPIVRASEFVPQLYRPFRLGRRQFGIAVFWILNGLIKKIVLSDYLATHFIDRVFDNPLLFSGAENLLALFAYSLQVYADFSGYTDIAIGVAMLMGFYLPRNFHSPYKAANPQEFWRRWHISLSRWLKTYVYIPLGGNRNATPATYIWLLVIAVIGTWLSGSWWVAALMSASAAVVALVAYVRPEHRKLLYANMNSFLTMLLGGLWHGASWNFLIWGGLNGLGMIANKLWREWHRAVQWGVMLCLTAAVFALRYVWAEQAWLNVACVWLLCLLVGASLRLLVYVLHGSDKPVSLAIGNAWAVTQTFVFITFTRLFFRSGSNLDPATANEQAWQTARQMLAQIGSAWDTANLLPVLWEHRVIVLLFVIGMLIHWMPDKFKLWYRIRFASLPVWVIIPCVVLIVMVLYQFMRADMQPFIYFQF